MLGWADGNAVFHTSCVDGSEPVHLERDQAPNRRMGLDGVAAGLRQAASKVTKRSRVKHKRHRQRCRVAPHTRTQ